MKTETRFERTELKYLITRSEQERLLATIRPYIQADEFGHTTIRNIYFDTENHLLIRRSLEKPVYKEKLRVRSYERATADSPVFVELKKKYKSIVYKRRLILTEAEAMRWLGGEALRNGRGQVADEIDYVLQFYGELIPSVFLSYERDAYLAREDSHLRITFDTNILFRETDLSLRVPPYGTQLLDCDTVMMEIKTAGPMPLWLSHYLSEASIYKNSFSKYGSAYKLLQTRDGQITEGVYRYA